MTSTDRAIPMPNTVGTLAQHIAKVILRLMGWSVRGDLPRAPKFVLVVAPHTSNWDLPVGLVCGYALGLLSGWPYGFMAKADVFRGPLGWVLRRIGGIAIDRSSAHNVVEQMAGILRQRERLMLAITPEGTRKRTGYWKSGFYYIALQARVPIVLAYLDYGRKVGGIGPVLVPSGDVETDLRLVREFFAGITAKFPHQVGEIRFAPNDTAR